MMTGLKHKCTKPVRVKAELVGVSSLPLLAAASTVPVSEVLVNAALALAAG
jgi:hypothetical protein